MCVCCVQVYIIVLLIIVKLVQPYVQLTAADDKPKKVKKAWAKPETESTIKKRPAIKFSHKSRVTNIQNQFIWFYAYPEKVHGTKIVITCVQMNLV